MGSDENITALALLDFWLSAGPERWFARSDVFDEACGTFVAEWARARDGEFDDWGRTAAGSLALILLLDQIPRNVFRGTAQQFATDAKAVTAADAAAAAGHHLAYPWPVRNFLFLPYQHAEDMAAQDRGLALYRRGANQEFYYYALVHADAIRRFGRFPHRNAVLERATTPEEQDYLDTGGFSI